MFRATKHPELSLRCPDTPLLNFARICAQHYLCLYIWKNERHALCLEVNNYVDIIAKYGCLIMADREKRLGQERGAGRKTWSEPFYNLVSFGIEIEIWFNTLRIYEIHHQ